MTVWWLLLACAGTDGDSGMPDDSGASDPELCPDGSAPQAWGYDSDGDGFGGAFASELTCAAPSDDAMIPDVSDCDDTNPEAYPGAEEVLGDGVDQSCGPSPGDADNDDYAVEDCDDTDPERYPGAPERCTAGVDQDCDGITPACVHFLDEPLTESYARVDAACGGPVRVAGRRYACTSGTRVRVADAAGGRTLPVNGALLGLIRHETAGLVVDSALLETDAGRQLWVQEDVEAEGAWRRTSPGAGVASPYRALGRLGGRAAWIDGGDGGLVARSAPDADGVMLPDGATALSAHGDLVLVDLALHAVGGGPLPVEATGTLVVDQSADWAARDVVVLASAGALTVVQSVSSSPNAIVVSGGGRDFSRGCVHLGTDRPVLACDFGGEVALWETPLDPLGLQSIDLSAPDAVYQRTGPPPPAPSLGVWRTDATAPESLVVAEEDRLLVFEDER